MSENTEHTSVESTEKSRGWRGIPYSARPGRQLARKIKNGHGKGSLKQCALKRGYRKVRNRWTEVG